MRKFIGYIRQENGKFHEKEKSLNEFAEENNIFIERTYFERSGSELDDLRELKKILVKCKKVVLLVSDISDIFEGDESIILASKLWEKDILVIDINYPEFRYENIIQDICDNPDDFLRAKSYVIVKTYLRKISSEKYCSKFSLSDRVYEWNKKREENKL